MGLGWVSVLALQASEGNAACQTAGSLGGGMALLAMGCSHGGAESLIIGPKKAARAQRLGAIPPGSLPLKTHHEMKHLDATGADHQTLRNNGDPTPAVFGAPQGLAEVPPRRSKATEFACAEGSNGNEWNRTVWPPTLPAAGRWFRAMHLPRQRCQGRALTPTLGPKLPRPARANN